MVGWCNLSEVSLLPEDLQIRHFQLVTTYQIYPQSFFSYSAWQRFRTIVCHMANHSIRVAKFCSCSYFRGIYLWSELDISKKKPLFRGLDRFTSILTFRNFLSHSLLLSEIYDSINEPMKFSILFAFWMFILSNGNLWACTQKFKVKKSMSFQADSEDQCFSTIWASQTVHGPLFKIFSIAF